MHQTVGILGGMGPLATVDLFAKIVANTPAVCDQHHLRIIIDNNPEIPPRVEAIEQGAESPLPAMVYSARALELAGTVADNPHLEEFNAMLDQYASAGVAAIMVGCTELPLLLPYLKGDMLRFDATLLLAQMVVAQAMGPRAAQQ